MGEDSEARKKLINPDLYEPIERYGELSGCTSAEECTNTLRRIVNMAVHEGHLHRSELCH